MSDPPFINGKMPFDFGPFGSKTRRKMRKNRWSLRWKSCGWRSSVRRGCDDGATSQRADIHRETAGTNVVKHQSFFGVDMLLVILSAIRWTIFLVIDWMFILTSHMCEYACSSILPYSSTHQMSRCAIRTGLSCLACPQGEEELWRWGCQFSTFYKKDTLWAISDVRWGGGGVGDVSQNACLHISVSLDRFVHRWHMCFHGKCVAEVGGVCETWLYLLLWCICYSYRSSYACLCEWDVPLFN